MLPVGNYTIGAAYTGSYWLSQSTASSSKSLSLGSSTQTTVTLAQYPPAFTSTIGFLLIMGIVVAVVIVAVAVFAISRRKK